MDLYEFNINPFDKRAQLVWEHGQHIATRTEGDNRILLFNMGKFFAEVWYGVDDNQIEQVRGFKSIKCLEPYLDQVDINHLIKDN